MTGPRTALWVIPMADLGGVARQALDVARVGIPGWRVVFCCPEGPLAEALRDAGAAVVAAPFGPAAGLRASVVSLRRVVARLRPAVVHTHLAYADIAAAVAFGGRRRRPVLVSTEHGIAGVDGLYHGGRLKGRLMQAVHRARCSAFDELIAVSESTRDVMLAKWRPRRPITVLYNGVERAADATARQPGLRVASLSRLAPEKNLDAALRAFALVRRDHPDARLVVAGTGPLDADMRRQASELGLGESVSFPGHVPAADVIAASDVLVQVSVWENCSYTILDAVAAGLGVVATPVGGNPEILPAQCFTEPDPDAVARLIVDQGLARSPRPSLPPGWPSVAQMAGQLGEVYVAVERRNARETRGRHRQARPR